MKFCLFFLFLSLSASLNAETNFSTRLLFHSTKQISKGFGISGWLIAPNVSSSPSTWLTILGGRYDGEGWSTELGFGGVFDNGSTTWLADFRFELTPKLWSVPLYTWGNVQLVNLKSPNQIYTYFQLDYVTSLGLLGLETENTHKSGNDDLSVGPHIVVPFKSCAIIIAYQLHTVGPNQLWTRLVLSL